MMQHMQTHMEQKFKCDYCPKVFATEGYQKQHHRYHTGGFPCYCGIKVQNKTAKQKHQATCNTCIDIRNNKKKARDDAMHAKSLSDLESDEIKSENEL